MARGKGNLGDKTVLDSLDAVARSLVGVPPEQMARVATASAGEVVEAFRSRPCLLGRARMFGERSVGLADPGQLAFQRILEGLHPA
ncbi:DAK2 domain-containing protein [Gemmobacter sp. 24YEA27]|uniref:DAK2 domain-containing protein n=1 Tax=Gemmobacter sp. 24YEA27 TaxID=3040672 RepID=UPI0024B35CF9|nr:DAK2 domain-containing protein [Gemmobacter sp. 24YEA27]